MNSQESREAAKKYFATRNVPPQLVEKVEAVVEVASSKLTPAARANVAIGISVLTALFEVLRALGVL